VIREEIVKRKYYVINYGFPALGIGKMLDFKSGRSLPVCKKRFKEIAGFLPKKGETIPITIKITKGHKI